MITGTKPLLRAGLVCLVVAAAMTALAYAADGAGAAGAAATGAGIVVLVLLSGALAVNLVAALMPPAALLVALLTYTMQMLGLLAVFLALKRSEMFSQEGEPAWLAGSVVALTLAWTVVHLVIATRARIPAYDLD